MWRTVLQDVRYSLAHTNACNTSPDIMTKPDTACASKCPEGWHKPLLRTLGRSIDQVSGDVGSR